MKSRFGNMFIGMSLLFCLELFLLAKPDIAALWQRPWMSLAQLSGLLGVVAYSITFFLSSRLGYLEYMFGGLDTVYRVHQRMGRVSFLLFSLHFVGLLVHYTNVSQMVMNLLIPSANIAYTAGILSFWSLTFIFAMIIFARLEYQLFVRIQTFFILSFLLGFIHSLFIESDISRYLPLRVYILSFFGLGIFSCIYRQLLYSRIGPKHSYTVSFAKRSASGWIMLRLKALGKDIQYIPGQFVYIGFEGEKYKKETHPFSIVSVPEDGHVELWIKPVGDYTLELSDVTEGDKVTVYGPYGALYEKIFGKDTVVCIAGGIGVTPFLGLLRKFATTTPSTSFHLFYSVRSKNEVEDLNLTSLLPVSSPNMNYHERITESQPRLSADEILKIVNHTRKSMYLLCGPHSMMQALKNQLYSAGVHPRMIFYEEFSY